MADTAQLNKAQASSQKGGARRLIPRFKGINFLRGFGVFIVFSAVFVASGSFIILTGATDFEPAPEVWPIIWAVNAVLILTVVALVLTEVVVLMQARSRQHAGARLQMGMVTMFAVVAAVPAFIVAIVATIALNQGLDQWFSERTRSMVESSRLVAQSYLNEHAQVLRDDIIWIATELEEAHDIFETDRDRYQRILTSLAVTRSTPFTSLVSRDADTLMRALINTSGKPPEMTPDLMQDVIEGIPTLIAPGPKNPLVGAVVKLRGYEDTFVFAARAVDPEVLQYVRLTDENITEYRQYASNRLVFQITFTIMYVGFALVLLLAAVWIGIALANRFVSPIRDLMIASGRVSRGDLDVSVPVPESEGDLHDLTLRFNSMTEQLLRQRSALVDASETNEKRRQFTEAVVEGVSAGIIGLDPSGSITLINATACKIFGKSELDVLGKDLSVIAPELAPFLNRAKSARRGQIQAHVQLGFQAAMRSFQVRLTREGTMAESKGIVVTLDDISDLETAQRNSAWADVARRIAHEIKNPLTPIQLSAERLRRRYGEKLKDDSDVFDRCISTIVRQVGDIGRMVDEFSSFARMPTASLQKADLSDVIRQTVFLESVRQPEIKMKVTLPDNPLIVFCDDHLISQALTNLVKNALEAIENVGIPNIAAPQVHVSAEVSGEYVIVKVSDNGKGWPRENRQQLLEPYVTTREKGTGLGLAIVAKIIEQHGGRVELQNAKPDAEGRVGACFCFTLPIEAREIDQRQLEISSDTDVNMNSNEQSTKGAPQV